MENNNAKLVRPDAVPESKWNWAVDTSKRFGVSVLEALEWADAIEAHERREVDDLDLLDQYADRIAEEWSRWRAPGSARKLATTCRTTAG